MDLYVRISGKGDGIYEVVAFVGGDYNPWAILKGGERLKSVPLDDLRIVSYEELVAEKHRRQAEATQQFLAAEGY